MKGKSLKLVLKTINFFWGIDNYINNSAYTSDALVNVNM